jgi:hypothetical protein
MDEYYAIDEFVYGSGDGLMKKCSCKWGSMKCLLSING